MLIPKVGSRSYPAFLALKRKTEGYNFVDVFDVLREMTLHSDLKLNSCVRMLEYMVQDGIFEYHDEQGLMIRRTRLFPR